MYPNTRSYQPSEGTGGGVRVHLAGAVIDAVGVAAAPGAVALQGGRVVAAGEAQKVLAIVGDTAPKVHLPDRLLIPGLVNAHVHLDLTSLGHRPYPGSFINWVKLVLRERPGTPDAQRGAVEAGARLSMEAGVMRVGDIASSPAATAGLQATALRGVSYAELIGGGERVRDQLYGWPGQIDERVRVGITPHAPYSTRPDAYALAAATEVRWLSTHLAETLEELKFVAAGTGPWRELHESLGTWSAEAARHYTAGLHPLDWLVEATGAGRAGRAVSGSAPPPAPWLVAHCNYVEDAHIQTLARLGWSVAYCPRASDYFGHRGHRYRDMVARGVNVCLGTDSILCHGTLSILDEMRHLYRRDTTDPRLLLRMATVNAMHGLQLPAIDATFCAGARSGVVSLEYHGGDAHEALGRALQADAPPVVVQGIEGGF